MIISRDKEFIRRKDEARQPAREPVKDTLAGRDRSEQDYDLRRARDAPTTSETRRRQQPRPTEPEYVFASSENDAAETRTFAADREADFSHAAERAVSVYEESGQPEHRGNPVLSDRQMIPGSLVALKKLAVPNIRSTSVPFISTETNISSVSKRRLKQRNRRNHYRRMSKRLPSWNLPPTSSRRRPQIKS